MAQLIENKPPRRAPIATLSHLCPSRRFGILSSRHGGAYPKRYRFVGRSFSSDITDDARSAFLCAGSIAACIRSFDRSSKCRISNRQNPELETHLSPAESMYAPLLIDRAYQLEIGLTPCRINTNAISNRRWIAVSANRSSC